MTERPHSSLTFVRTTIEETVVNELKVIALTHKHFSLDEIGRFHIAPEERIKVLSALKEKLGLSGLMYLSTCNRVEIIFSLPHYLCQGQTYLLLQALFPQQNEQWLKEAAGRADRFNGTESVEHMLRVASGLESLVIGEREIITQLRKSFEDCAAADLTSDNIRIAIHQCIRTAKEIFTHTDLSRKPVSVVSLAWKQFQESGIRRNERILLIGAGQIIRNFSKFLSENGYHNIVVANRSLENAAHVAAMTGGKAIPLSGLKNYSGGFDALISCTASEETVISEELYRQLLCGESTRKLIIDLAIPRDIDPSVISTHPVQYIDMMSIQKIAAENIQYREQAIVDCQPVIAEGLRNCERTFQERRIEQAMRSIPETIKEIKSTALGNVFAKDLEKLDDTSKEILEKILGYMEKKYISVPMKMAREVLLDEVKKN